MHKGHAHTWDGLGEGQGRVEQAQRAGEHAAALGQRHQAQEHPVACALCGQLGRVRDTQIPGHRLHATRPRTSSLCMLLIDTVDGAEIGLHCFVDHICPHLNVDSSEHPRGLFITQHA